MEVGGGMMRPVQILAIQTDPLDSHVIFNVDGAMDLLRTWSLTVTDDRGAVQQYGPFTRDQESVTGRTILGDRTEGNYMITMNGVTKNGAAVRKESSVSLIRQNDVNEKGFRYSILFDFDRENAIAAYDKFLTDVVSPLITNGSTVVIHGYTDIIGEEGYNYTLSQNRAQHTQRVIEAALSSAGKTGVRFQTSGYGEDVSRSPFENNLPEERFYNRTVIIDIVPSR
jgi:outer membrane protein OmpA-like peptidoglycan-associated protein